MVPAPRLVFLPVTLALAAAPDLPAPAPPAPPAAPSPSPPAPHGPWLDAAGATPRWDRPLSLRLGLHAPPGDDTPLPRHCLTPSLHYGAWPVPAAQVRWRIEHDPAQRRAWLSLESPLRVSEPWVDLNVEWHCGATHDRQVLTLLVEPDWPGDEASLATHPGKPPDDAPAGTGRAAPPVRLSHVTATDLDPFPPTARVEAQDWAGLLERLARLEAGAARHLNAPPLPPGARLPALAAPVARPSPPGAALAGAAAGAVPAAAAASHAAEAAPFPAPPASPTQAASALPVPARVVSVAPALSAWASPWPWMLASGLLGWVWGRRPRGATLPGGGSRSAPAAAAARAAALSARPAPARLADAATAPAASGRWPAWFGAPTRPETGPWWAGGLPRPEPPLARPALQPAMPEGATTPGGDTPPPWNHGLVLTEIGHLDIGHTGVELAEIGSGATAPSGIGPSGIGPDPAHESAAPKRTAAKAAVAGGGPA